MARSTTGRSQLFAEALSVLFMGLIVAAANVLHLFYILFPELGALASDVLLRPGGKWAKEPWKLVATPSATAVLGTVITTHLHYGVLTILLTMALSIGTVFGLRSAVAPAISAGVLPVVLGITSWLYPLCIVCTLSVLACTLLVWRQTPVGKSLSPTAAPDDSAVEVLESTPDAHLWFGSLFLFVAIVGAVAQVTDWRFILFPPLIVIAYEMLGHPETCAWAKAPFSFPVVCALSALAGVEMVEWFGVSPIGAALVLVFTFASLRLFRLRMPPALAIGLIPYVLPHPSLMYALSVGIGTTALMIWFLGYRKVLILLA